VSISLARDEGITLESPAMAKKNSLKPGKTAPNSGQYRQVGPRGGKGREITSTKGEPLPPTTKSGSTYKLVDRTDNKSGRG
jgi:hypothetical protein